MPIHSFNAWWHTVLKFPVYCKWQHFNEILRLFFNTLIKHHTKKPTSAARWEQTQLMASIKNTKVHEERQICAGSNSFLHSKKDLMENPKKKMLTWPDFWNSFLVKFLHKSFLPRFSQGKRVACSRKHKRARARENKLRIENKVELFVFLRK